MKTDRAGQPTLRDSMRAMPRTAWTLFLGAFVNRLGSFVLPFLTLYLTKRGYSAPQAGLGIAAYGLGAIASQGFGGTFADRLGRRNTIAFSMFAGAAFTVLLPEVTGLPAILSVVVLLGLVAELYRPAASALLADVVDSEHRVASFTLQRLAINLGWAIGLALGGALADHSFRWLFWADAFTSAAFGVIALIALPQGVRSSKRNDHAAGGGALTFIRADKGFLLYLVAVFLIAAIFMQSATTFALQIRALGYSYKMYGLLLGFNGAIIFFLELAVTSRTQRRDRLRMVALGGALLGIGFGSLVFAHSLPLLVGMTVIWTFGEMIEAPNASAFVADRAPEHLRGRYQAASGSMFAFAAVIGPIVGTAVFQTSPNGVWIGCAALGMLAAVMALAAHRAPIPAPAAAAGLRS
jgi:MFS family permease